MLAQEIIHRSVGCWEVVKSLTQSLMMMMMIMLCRLLNAEYQGQCAVHQLYNLIVKRNLLFDLRRLPVRQRAAQPAFGLGGAGGGGGGGGVDSELEW